MIKVRFAPSPTGMLHIGGARTALFNWLFARHNKGKYYLRIEDTDRERSTNEAVQAIFDSLNWLGLDHDDEVVFQFERANRHAEVAHQLVKDGKAYYCYCSIEELEQMREDAKKNGLTPRYNGYWRDRDPALTPNGITPVVRLKSPLDGETAIIDLVQGTVKINNAQLDDMVLLRADGTPTYMLSVVVDDHDMDITHIIRGDDHLNNAFRQYHLYKACGWDVPAFAHIPLIHGSDGAKMSKRHGATGTDAYKEMGILPEAMKNYLLRLGWSHGDDEIIPIDKAIEWFNLEHIGRSPSRFDVMKLYHLNAHYIKNADNNRLLNDILPLLKNEGFVITAPQKTLLIQGMNGLKERAKTLVELKEGAKIYLCALPLDEKATLQMTEDLKKWIIPLKEVLLTLNDYTVSSIESTLRAFAEKNTLKIGIVAMALRCVLTGRTVSPNLFEVISILGQEEVLKRLNNFLEMV
ncbi:MAG: glutamate--tRNA ligase [Proteobacteria bacterium]|nr:glutamate--tRNA ligase [Pseudomonadota bacterium]